MINKIYKSIFTKPTAFILATSMLLMSFTTNGSSEIILNAGTNVSLETLTYLRSDQVSVGQIIDFKVRMDVKVGDKVAIKAGSIAKGQVMRAQIAKGLGKAGFFEIKIKSVTSVDGQEIYLSGGNFYQEGQDKETESILLGIFICILFLTMKGKDAEIPQGYEVNSTVASTTTIKV